MAEEISRLQNVEFNCMLIVNACIDLLSKRTSGVRRKTKCIVWRVIAKAHAERKAVIVRSSAFKVRPALC